MVIFLDIDGVMVPMNSWKRPELLKDGFPSFSNKATIALNKLIAEGAKIILTTSHKSNYTIEEWINIFQKRGVQIETIQKLQDNRDNLNRRQEIEKWFLMNNIADNFIILDDDKLLNDLPPYLKSHLVLTSAMIGLTEEHLANVKSAIESAFSQSK